MSDKTIIDVINDINELKLGFIKIENDNKLLKKELRILKEAFDKLKGKNIIF